MFFQLLFSADAAEVAKALALDRTGKEPLRAHVGAESNKTKATFRACLIQTGPKSTFVLQDEKRMPRRRGALKIQEQPGGGCCGSARAGADLEPRRTLESLLIL